MDGPRGTAAARATATTGSGAGAGTCGAGAKLVAGISPHCNHFFNSLTIIPLKLLVVAVVVVVVAVAAGAVVWFGLLLLYVAEQGIILQCKNIFPFHWSVSRSLVS